ncbi:MAG: hypothetical protein COT38_01550 [Candidatus Omnitrophica bacterium CG08_land_8_20_14_0_20_41_16]|uniref:Colicin V production protein n=1 Tax=Candidatus Sherwoodlollariibacterium unditelluris TaxID=1974757 RepID=A0A2G9YK68_9BACT|nr:MAG: hypothetical protein COX41_05635 [Candidatus Omnitrophica bacterium CG23_combo_of_CG06-09_8_20_14_all_41_10]PIS34159.1 MAG: hypothetical protein COT38_01550 [Candidatus Omnitrophica bacterium CG08_land_8_20_14_0_20_41_16]
MLLNTLKQFNWLDIFILIMIFRICYIALKAGFPIEVFKFLGSLTAIYVSMHYYTMLSDFIKSRIPIEENMPLEFIDFLVFLLLAISGYLLFVLLRSVFSHFIKIEAVSALNKWGGLILGLFRSILLVSLIFFTLAISSVSYLKDSVKRSYLGPRLFSIAPDTYAWAWNNLASKFINSEKQNNVVLEVKKEILPK